MLSEGSSLPDGRGTEAHFSQRPRVTWQYAPNTYLQGQNENFLSKLLEMQHSLAIKATTGLVSGKWSKGEQIALHLFPLYSNSNERRLVMQGAILYVYKCTECLAS